MNTVKKPKAKAQKTKLIRRKMRLRKNGKKRLPSRSVLKRKVQKTEKKAKTPTFDGISCECKKTIEIAKELKERFQNAAEKDFYVEEVRVNRNKKQEMQDIEPLVEERALKITEEMRYEWNEKRLKLCSHCLCASIDFFKRMYRWIIHYTLGLESKCGGTQDTVGFYKVKKCYFELLAAQTRTQIKRLYGFFYSLEDVHADTKTTLAKPFTIDGPKQLVFPNAYQRDVDDLPRLAEDPQRPVYQFLRDEQNMEEYMDNLQENLEYQQMRVLDRMDLQEVSGTESRSIQVVEID